MVFNASSAKTPGLTGFPPTVFWVLTFPAVFGDETFNLDKFGKFNKLITFILTQALKNVLYLFYMNKETIYIEPGDDITDILSKLKASEKKVVALVPPKRPGVLLSAVNIKLIARTAKSEKKAVVLVTTDDSLTKLAMHANLPVASSLKSRPVMPEDSAEPKEESKVEAKEKSEEEPEDKPAVASKAEPSALEEASEEAKVVDAIESEESAEPEESEDIKDSAEFKPAKKSKEPKAKKESGSPVIAWINRHKAWLIFGILAVAAIVVFFVWALKIAPFVDVAVSVRTTSGNFSENVSFTTVSEEEKALDGIFYAREEKLEKDQTVKFTATGQKDLGEPASGSLIIYFVSTREFNFDFKEGTKFTYNGLEYVATSSATLYWDGGSISKCDNKDDYKANEGCQISTSISIKSSAPGEKYNVEANQSGWTTAISGPIVYNREAISGGTSNIVTVVQQSDVDLALNKLESETKDTGKTELLGKLSENVLPIDASFKASATEPKSSPAVGEEVPEGTTPTVSSKTTYTILTIDRVRLEEFITDRANLDEGRKLYSVGEPFVEYFTESGDHTYSAKLKTTYKSGPEVSETEILEKIQGQKIGRVEPILKDAFSGISTVSIEKSYFWVNAVPSNPNQVKIKVEIEE